MTASQLGDDVPLYSVGVVAERLGIPTATLRSWNRRYGIGPSQRDPGSHRLYTEADVAAVRRMQFLIGEGASARSAARASASPRHADSAGLLAAAFALDCPATELLIDGSIRRRGVVNAWDSLLRPTFVALSTLQGQGANCLDVEHLLSRATTLALQRVSALATPVTPTASAAAVVLACCDGEVHTLALEALAAALAQRGCAVVMLGASVPATAITTALERLPAVRVVVLWAQRAATADSEAVRTVASAGASALVAGPGWTGVPLGGHVGRLATLRAAVERLARTQS